MRGRKLAIVCSAGALSLGLIGVPAAALAADDGGAQAQPTITQTGSSFTVTLPGVGSLSFSVDPTTHDLTGLMVTPADPSILAGTPVLTDEGVRVLFTSPTGAQTLEVEVEGEGAVPVIKAEAEGSTDDGAPTAAGTEGNENGTGDNENEAGDINDDPGENEGAPPATPTTTSTTTGTDDRSGDGAGDGSDATTPPTAPSPSTTTTTSGDDGGSNSTSNGSGDGGSGSSSSGDGGHGSDG